MLGALASCLIAGVATVATNRGVQLRSVTATVSGDMDLQGILGIDAEVRNGFDRIDVRFDIDVDASPADIQALWRSPRSVPPSLTSSPTPRPCR